MKREILALRVLDRSLLSLAWPGLLVGLTACALSHGKEAGPPSPAPSFMNVSIYRGDAQPKTVRGATFVVTTMDADSTRTITSMGPDAPRREYPLSSTGTLRVQVTVRGNQPFVEGDASVAIPLQPDLLLSVFVYAWAPTMNPRLYGCGCPHRVAFPLRAANTIQDSLIIAWWPRSRSHGDPIY